MVWRYEDENPISSIFVDPSFPQYETTYDEQCAPGTVESHWLGIISDL